MPSDIARILADAFPPPPGDLRSFRPTTLASMLSDLREAEAEGDAINPSERQLMGDLWIALVESLGESEANRLLAWAAAS